MSLHRLHDAAALRATRRPRRLFIEPLAYYSDSNRLHRSSSDRAFLHTFLSCSASVRRHEGRSLRAVQGGVWVTGRR